MEFVVAVGLYAFLRTYIYNLVATLSHDINIVGHHTVTSRLPLLEHLEVVTIVSVKTVTGGNP